MLRLIHQVHSLDQPMRGFMDERGGACYGYTLAGTRYDVSRLLPLQNPIENNRDFFTYLLMETRSRFFWLDQHMQEGLGQGWVLRCELTPHYAPTFLLEFPRLFGQFETPGRINWFSLKQNQ